MDAEDGNGVALVVGDTGIVGRTLSRALHEQGWRVLGLSRGLEVDLLGAVHVSADLSDPEGFEKVMEEQDVLQGVTHVFYCTWAMKDTEEEMVQANAFMMTTLLNALERFQSRTRLHHITLVTGTKRYCAHLGPHKTPQEEDDERLRVPNFYYQQEDLLLEGAERLGYTWTVERPHSIVGLAQGNMMNMGASIAVYASLCKHLGQKMEFPGAPGAWHGIMDVTSSDILVKHLIWSAKEPKAANQAFNITNGEVFRWKYLWPKIAAYFGLEASYNEDRYIENRLVDKMKDKEPVWQDIVQKHQLQPLRMNQLAVWWHLDADLGRNYDAFSSMAKSRKLGFLEYEDTLDCFIRLFEQLRSLKYIP